MVASRVRDGHREWGVARFDLAFSYLVDPVSSMAAMVRVGVGVGAVVFFGTAEERYREGVWDRLRARTAHDWTSTAHDVIYAFGAGAGVWKWPERRLAVVDRNGAACAYTGDEANPWAGDLCGDGFAALGDSLRGPHVLEAMKDAWSHQAEALPLTQQLVGVLLAARTAGGCHVTSRRMGGLVATVSEAPESIRTHIAVCADPLDELAELVIAN